MLDPERGVLTLAPLLAQITPGVVVDAGRGYVLTNNHVIADAQEIQVTLKDRRTYPARLIGSDPETDVALLGIDAPDLSAVALGDSDRLAVGDVVVAIATPSVPARR